MSFFKNWFSPKVVLTTQTLEKLTMLFPGANPATMATKVLAGALDSLLLNAGTWRETGGNPSEHTLRILK